MIHEHTLAHSHTQTHTHTQTLKANGEDTFKCFVWKFQKQSIFTFLLVEFFFISSLLQPFSLSLSLSLSIQISKERGEEKKKIRRRQIQLRFSEEKKHADI